jgi:rSAM/selenodomain-associated transferase 2
MLSAVVPTLNAAATLPDCLAALRGSDEIVVVDGGSTDATRAIAEAAGARFIHAPKGRGVQLASGAEAAQGSWLLFVHADTRLSEGWQSAAKAHIAAAPAKAACFRLRLDDPAWQARVIERGVRLRVGLLGLAYGDQGLLISRALYDAVGGYAPLPLMEDVDLARRLGRRRIAQLEAFALTSAERWRRDGWWRRSARNLSILARYRLGMSAERAARLYD